jgi:simple sugar transport system substrate-binding protein
MHASSHGGRGRRHPARALAAWCLAFLPACGAESAADRRPVVGFSQIGAESAWRVAETASIVAEAEARGVDLKLVDAQGRMEKQLEALRGFVAQQVDAVILAPQKEQGFEPVLKELKEAGIPVVLVDRGVQADPALHATLIASDFVAEGRMAAEWLARASTGDVRVVELEGTTGSAPAIDRKKGFHEALAAHPRLRVVRSQPAQFSLAEGKKQMEAILRSEPEPFQAVYAHNDDMALGAIEALKAAGRAPGKNVLVVSIDATRPAFEAMVRGELSAAVECSPLLGPAALDAVQALLRGERVEPRIVVQDRLFTAADAAAELPNRRY